MSSSYVNTKLQGNIYLEEAPNDVDGKGTLGIKDMLTVYGLYDESGVNSGALQVIGGASLGGGLYVQRKITVLDEGANISNNSSSLST